MKLFVFFCTAILLLQCSSTRYAKPTVLLATVKIPAAIRGSFSDDYGIQYNITDTLWTQMPNVKYKILFVDTTARYILAKNGSENPSDKGLYTRIDYMSFTGMKPYEWGFCLTIYDAQTMKDAQQKIAANRDNPKKGCNGYPFSRMKKLL